MLFTTLVYALIFPLSFCRILYENNHAETLNGINVCSFRKFGDSKSCKIVTNLHEFKLDHDDDVKVEIVDQTLKKLYKYSFSDLLCAKELNIKFCKLAEIEPGAFNNSLTLLNIDLQFNNLDIIKYGVFNHLLIITLNLSHNKIRTIETEALSFMQNIEEVNLIDNLISSYDEKWFCKTPSLKSLNFQNNSIKEIPTGAFHNLLFHDLNLFFSFNKINSINHLALQNITIRKFYMDHNLLETWSEALSMNINELNISFNNIKILHGNIQKIIKNNSLNNFIGNPYQCYYLKEIKTIGDNRGEYSKWFGNKYFNCRREMRKINNNYL